MAKIGAGRVIQDLKKKIRQAQSDLERMEPPKDMPELITSANLLRSNEYLSRTNEKKTELLCAYAHYSEELEKMLSAVFDIQNDLKEIVKEQSAMISPKRAKPAKSRARTRKARR